MDPTVAGAALCLTGVGLYFGVGFITEGFRDIISASQKKNSGWKSYFFHKSINMTISLATAGIGHVQTKSVSKIGMKIGLNEMSTISNNFNLLKTQINAKIEEIIRINLSKDGVVSLLRYFYALDGFNDGDWVLRNEIIDTLEKTKNRVPNLLVEQMKLLAPKLTDLISKQQLNQGRMLNVQLISELHVEINKSVAIISKDLLKELSKLNVKQKVSNILHRN